jgi:DNA-binding response OmpR family regulator
VLLVEDEEPVLKLGRRILEQHGYTVLEARTPEVALVQAAERRGQIQLLVTDVIMPGMNGRELLRRIDPLQPGMRCLFMSGYTADVIAHHGVLENGVEFLQKPFTMQTLTTKVRHVLNARTPTLL